LDSVWQCDDCPTIIHRHPDAAHESQAWTDNYIADHQAVHVAQLAEHDGDREALRMRLNHPGRYAALTQLKHTSPATTDQGATVATILGLDYAGGVPDAAAIAAAGYTFVARYLTDGGPTLPGKLLSPAEADALRTNGIDIVANWETTADRMLDGYDAGAADAQQALAQMLNCGGPTGRPIYFSADFDATEAQQTQIDDYLRGAASVLLVENVGIYGGYWPVSRALTNGTATWAWQTGAWSGGQVDPRAHIYQQIGAVTVDGIDCDVNQALATDYGQWSATTGGTDMQLSDQLTDAYGNQVSVGDVLKWISFHADLSVDALGGVGSRDGLPPAQKMTGHACLGGDDVVKALARIGQALKLPGYDPTGAE
jgi:hypothetical protein